MTRPPAATATATSRRRRWTHPLQSVRVRITLATAVVTAVAVGAAGWLLVRSVEDEQIRQLRSGINADLDTVATRLREGGDPQMAIERVSSPTFGFLQVTDERGNIVASVPTFVQRGRRVTVRLREGPLPPSTEVSPAPTDTVIPGEGPPLLPPPAGADATGALVGESGVLVGALETIARTVDGPTGDLTVTAAAPVDQVARSVVALRKLLVVGLPALVALVAGIAWTLVGRTLRPVDTIRAEADEITSSTLHRRVPEPPTGDEIGRLARTMNAMLNRLDAAAIRQRQFVSDASHELRSPVAAIRTALEVARHKGGDINWPAVADTALAEEARLEALLDDLLLLAAHDEAGAAPVATTSVNLADLADVEARRSRRVPVHLSHPSVTETLAAPGVHDQLGRVVGNLVDNAARYATTAVHLSLERHDGRVRLIVDDDGPGIAAADRERVFERFTRLDHGRARNQGGTGLGLALVRTIVTRHHGEVWVEENPSGGARFIVELPASSPRVPHLPGRAAIDT